MAQVFDKYELAVTLVDSGLNQSVLRFALVEATLYTDALADAQAIVALLEAVSAAEVKGYTVYGRYVEDNLTLPAAGTQVENIAALTCQLEDPTKSVVVKIPAPAVSIFLASQGAGANIVDVSNANVLAYVDIWQATGALASISDGEFIADGSDAILAGKRIHRQSSRG